MENNNLEGEKLTDKQLYALTRDKDLSPKIKRIMKEEFAKRNFSIDYIDRLGVEYEQLPVSARDITGLEKILIVAIPFFPVIHAIFANRHISKGNLNKWKLHWRYVALGYVLWTVFVVLFARFYLFNQPK